MPSQTLFEEEIDVDEEKPKLLSYRGAIGLIELGKKESGILWNRTPRTKASMGDIFSDAGGFIFNIVGGGIEKIATLLADIIKIPLDLISTGVGTLLTTFADIVSNIPIIGDFVATILLAVNSLAQFVITLPETILKAVANLGKAFDTLSSDQKSKAWKTAQGLIVGSAPPSMQPTVQKAVTNAPTPAGVTLGPSVGEVLANLAAVAGPIALFTFFK